jgi:hypothetical protein
MASSDRNAVIVRWDSMYTVSMKVRGIGGVVTIARLLVCLNWCVVLGVSVVLVVLVVLVLSVVLVVSVEVVCTVWYLDVDHLSCRIGVYRGYRGVYRGIYK